MRVFRIVGVLLLVCVVSAGVLFAGATPEAGEAAAGPAAARSGKYAEAPEMAAMVKAGQLPPVDERLPENPMVVEPIEEIGVYGGTWKVFLDGQNRLTNILEWSEIGLVKWGRTQDVSIPCIASGWEVTDGGATFIFTLRKGIRWSDGQRFTADDVLFWWEDIVMNDDLYPVKPYWMYTAGQELGTMEKVDDTTVAVRFPEPHGMFILYLTKELWTYAPKHYLTQFHPKYTPMAELETKAKEAGFDNWLALFQNKFNVFGGGNTLGMNNPDLPVMNPWVATQVPPSERYVFKRNPYFFAVDTAGNQLPYIDQVDARVVNAEVMNLKIIAGEPNFQASRPQAFKDMPLYMQYAEQNEYNVFQWGDLQISEAAIWINQNTPDPVDRKIFQDVRFRRALSVAINREKINQTLYSGMGKPTAATLPPVEARYFKEEYARAYTQYDPAQADKWLDEAGLSKKDSEGYRLKPDGKRAAFVIECPNNRLGMIDNLNMIKDDYKAVGIELVIKPEAQSLWNTRMQSGQIQFGGWPMGKAASETDLVPISTNTDWGPLWGLWYNTAGAQGEEPPQHIKDLQNVWSEILRTTDDTKKDALYDKILKSQAENVWAIGVVGPVPKPIIAKKWFRNVKPDGVWSFHHGHFIGATEPYQFFIEKAHQ